MTRQLSKGAKIAIAVVAVAIIVCAVVFLVPKQPKQPEQPEPKNNEQLTTLLEEVGFIGSEQEWVDSLNDEQKAAIDIAYESSVASGYKGSKEDWIKTEVVAYKDPAGDVRVALPDGGEFTVTVASKNGASASAKIEDSSGADTSRADKSDGESKENAGQQNGGSSSSQEKPQDEPQNSEQPVVDGPIVAVQNANAQPGDTGVAVQVRVEKNPGILGLTLSVSYDESAMTLKDAVSGEAFKDVLTMTRSKEYGNGCLFLWDGVDIAPEDVKDGTILTLYFDVNQDAKLGAYPVAVRDGGTAVDKDLSGVELTMRDGSVIVG